MIIDNVHQCLPIRANVGNHNLQRSYVCRRKNKNLKTKKMFEFLSKTKTVAIISLVIVILLGVLVYANWDKLFPKKDESTKEESKNADEEKGE